MKNILSYGGPQLGKNIKEWVLYQLEHNTSKARIAKRLVKYLGNTEGTNGIDDDSYYLIYFDPRRRHKFTGFNRTVCLVKVREPSYYSPENMLRRGSAKTLQNLIDEQNSELL